MNHNRDDAAKIWQETGTNTSSVMVINHVLNDQIKKTLESPRYTTISFISDVGGILGVFLGVSFWSIHTAVIQPIVRKIENGIRSKKKTFANQF